jgi:hypothetical protein
MAEFFAELERRHLHWGATAGVRVFTALAAVMALGATACTPKFIDADYAPYHGGGAAVLEGQAYVELSVAIEGPASFRTCDGQPVILAPALAYDDYVLSNAGADEFPLETRAGPALPYWRKAICDSDGRFTFADVPTGDWIVITRVTFPTIVGTRNRGNVRTQGLGRKLTLRPGQNAVVMTTRLIYR